MFEKSQSQWLKYSHLLLLGSCLVLGIMMVMTSTTYGATGFNVQWVDKIHELRTELSQYQENTMEIKLNPWFFSDPIPAPNYDRNWNQQQYPSEDLNWQLRNLRDRQVHSIPVPEWHLAYLRRTITASEAGEMHLSLGSDDGFKLWINGALVAENNAKRPAQQDQDFVTIQLEAGENELILAIYNATEGSGFYFAYDIERSPVEEWAEQLWQAFPIQMDWLMQDSPGKMVNWELGRLDGKADLANLLAARKDASLEKHLVSQVIQELQEFDLVLASGYEAEMNDLIKSNIGPDDRQWLELYQRVCWERRRLRMGPLLDFCQEIIYVQRPTFGQETHGISVITEREGGHPSAALMKLDLAPEATADGYFASPQQLLSASQGIRDPQVSFDGTRLLFAQRVWGARHGVNYQIFEMDLTTGDIRQLTNDETYGGSFEPVYLGNDDILFSSSRIVAHTTCGWDDYSNFYIMDKDGNFARRVGFDQVHTAYPSILADGRVIFTRRDYNDRGQVFTHALFTMNQDGTSQQEFYGNHTFQPTSIQQAKEIPGTNRLLAVVGGYHVTQGGKLVEVDVSHGRQSNQGLTLIPSGEKPQDDGSRSNIGFSDTLYGRSGEQYQYPYPITEEAFLVSHQPIGGYRFRDGHVREKPENQVRYGVYFMHMDGRRELLVMHPQISSLQPVPVAPRERPHVYGSPVDYTKDYAYVTIHDIYDGRGLEGIERGTVKSLRVVQLNYKPTTIGGAHSADGPGGYGHSITPVAMHTGTYDTKTILGDVPVHEDGSVYFKMPTRRPVYFQALDEHNRVIQSMRSWTTSMPGEFVSCAGCHVSKESAPPIAVDGRPTMAMQASPEELSPFYGPARGFSYIQEVQPIWNEHCISCHSPGGENPQVILTDDQIRDQGSRSPQPSEDPHRVWLQSYVTLTSPERPIRTGLSYRPYYAENNYINWIGRLSTPEMVPPYSFGSARSPLFDLLLAGHDGRVNLSQEELDKVAAWIDLNIPFVGEYDESNVWTAGQTSTYNQRMRTRGQMELIEQRNIEALIESLNK